MIQFETIKDFINHRTKCPLCNRKLTPTIHSLMTEKDVKLTAAYKRGFFNFKMKYNSNTFNINGFIKGEDNTITMYSLIDNEPIANDTLYLRFVRNYPHIELTCNNKECKTYYINSDKFSINDGKIAPFKAAYESFNLNSFCIYNDLAAEETKIYSTERTDAQAIVVKLINFDSMPKERLFNKIRTIITFS